MDARPAVMRQWQAARQLAKERRSEQGNKGGLQLAPHKRQNVTKREKGVD